MRPSCTIVTIRAVLADGHDFQTARLCRFDDLLRIAIVNTNNGRTFRLNQILEQAKLGRQIRFDAGVIV